MLIICGVIFVARLYALAFTSFLNYVLYTPIVYLFYHLNYQHVILMVNLYPSVDVLVSLLRNILCAIVCLLLLTDIIAVPLIVHPGATMWK